MLTSSSLISPSNCFPSHLFLSSSPAKMIDYFKTISLNEDYDPNTSYSTHCGESLPLFCWLWDCMQFCELVVPLIACFCYVWKPEIPPPPKKKKLLTLLTHWPIWYNFLSILSINHETFRLLEIIRAGKNREFLLKTFQRVISKIFACYEISSSYFFPQRLLVS